MNAPIQKVVIVGGGTAGWMTATALAAVLKAPCQIELVESEEIGIVGVGEATIPTITLFNGLAQIDEAAFVRATQATFKLGIEFVNWGQAGDRYFHGFGPLGREVLWPVEFHQYWLRMRALGLAKPLDAYIMCNAAMHAGRFAKPPEGLPRSAPASGLIYAYHFDAGLYAQHLRQLAEARGVRRHEGRITRVLRHEEGGARQGFVRGVQLQSGQLIEGDLFVDCSGFHALLAGQTQGTAFEDWSHWLPCDRALAVPSESRGPLLPYTRATAHRAGWQWRIPLQHRVGNGHVYSSAHVSDDEAADTLLKHLDGPPLGEPRLIRFRTGMREQAWRDNVVAIGLASGFIEPLESTAIHLIQMGIGALVEFFPNAGFDPVEVAEYNRQHRQRYEAVRDFVILHYHLNQRQDSAFWRDCAAMAVPETLRWKMQLYAAAGRIVQREAEQFREASWLQVLEGQNLRPRGWLPLTDMQSVEGTASYLQGTADAIAQVVQQLPSHADFLRHYCS